MNSNLVSYYKDRAREYEKIYLKPERQDDLKSATDIIQNIFTDKNVFEIACGTGFWTEKIAQTAKSVVATDINDAVIEIAKQKKYSKNNVTFSIVDIYNLADDLKYDNIFGGFILSHIKRQDIVNFFDTMKQIIVPGGTFVFMDNNFVEGSNLPISIKDEDGNTFQTRNLDDGTKHLVLKNFFTKDDLTTILSDTVTKIDFIDLKYFWLLTFTS